ncbi:flagellar hook-associated protein FlgK [Xanthomonas sp. NCPPB 2654]|uniref:flagellar hook-associated protein FlgK n=1 Tax=unclassified Xanthomonas TaxID=2643310 RepID=UPI0021E0173F|nr:MULTISPECIES: flagellar hook-associated protein FlgK [unclassified Xanthomonas]MDL5366671.1 flagellar hook-associated protein FlgK [Xanthomonas sp. NCPPB 2654]UYC22687.1 flagellar hook-associated protein FlgK [Xanthomonas sp. CFBP 8443]
MSVLSTGTSALIAFQRALATVSHNVANINTDGYSRQRVAFATTTPTRYGSDYIGNGTKITDISRVADQLATSRLLDSGGELARLKQLSALSDRVDGLFSDTATNISGQWSKFFDASTGLSANASATASRQNLLDNAGSLVTRFKQLNGQMDALGNEVNNGLLSATTEANRVAAEVAKINGQIGSNAAAAAPDLLDRRDQLITQLVGYTGGSAVQQDGGAINVYTAGGQALVVGTTASTLTTVTDPYQPGRLQVALQAQGATIALGDSAMGGQIGGLLEFRSDVLDPTKAELGRLATGLAVTYNQQHKAGVDLYGNLGGDFFSLSAPSVNSNAANTGSASFSAAVSDLSKLDGKNLLLKFDGSTWTAARADTGASVAMTGTGSSADPFVVNGVTLQLSGTAAAGDKFLLQPTADAVTHLGVAITDPSRIAAATPITAKTDLDNLGTGKVSNVRASNAANPNLLNPSSIAFIDANQYTIDGAGPFAYTAGQTISANGWSLTLDGAPVAGDTFAVGPTGAGSSNNGNALTLSNLDDAKAFNGGTITLNGAVSGLTTTIGSAARQAKYAADAQDVIHTNAQDARDSVSGVNLDEEASNMLRLQQAYQAASQLISTADTMFQSILGAIR